MRRRYWLPAAALLLCGLLVSFFSFAYRFTGILLCLLAVLIAVFGLIDAGKRRFPRATRWVCRILIVCLVLVGVAATATGICIGTRIDGSENPSAEFAVVLGAGVNGSVPSQALRERLLAAERYLAQYPDAIVILSGGQGNNESITEARCMFDWLTARGADPARLRMEETATDTAQNISCSLALIESEFGVRPERIAVISSEYHLLRAGLLADRAGVEALCYPARTGNRIYFCQMFVREICGVWAELLLG